MILFFQNSASWLTPFFFIIPFSYFLTLKGIEIIVRKKSFRTTIFVGTVFIIVLCITAYFVLIEQIPIPYWLFNFTLPFGAGTYFIFDEHPENSISVRAFAFITGLMMNACAIGCLIHIGEKLYRLNKKINEFGKTKTSEEI